MRMPITAVVATRNEAKNLKMCLDSLAVVQRVIVVDSESTDGTPQIALAAGAELVTFVYEGGYPKKRQWALSGSNIRTPWVLLVDADERIPPELWDEISAVIIADDRPAAYAVKKGFHFLGVRMRFGGFSHAAVILFRVGKARFENLLPQDRGSLDMEVHERLIVDGSVGSLKNPLIHEDFKGLEAYIQRHNAYSTWEANLRFQYFQTGRYGAETIYPSIFGNSQARRRWLKFLVIRLPLEHWLWFTYHYVLRLGFLHGRRGLIACQVRASYIQQTRAKIFELAHASARSLGRVR